MKRSIIRSAAACALLLSAVAAESHTHATAGSALKTYRDSANHFSFEYPATWRLDLKLSDTTRIAASLGVKSGAAVAPSDSAAFFAVLVKPSDTSLAAERSAVTALVKEGLTVVGSIHYKDSSAAFGGNAMGAGANVRFDASHSGWVTVQAYVHNNKTYYNLQSELTRPAISNAENEQMKALVSSYVSD